MHERVDHLPRAWIAVDGSARDVFDARVHESSLLAFRVAYSVLRHRQQAEDVAQETLLRAYRALARLREPARFNAWLVRTAWRLALDELRAHRRRLARDTHAVDLRPSSPGPDVAADANTLWAAIDRLPERLRQPLVLASLEGHTIQEAAALLDLPEGTVKSRLFEARRLLKEWLQ